MKSIGLKVKLGLAFASLLLIVSAMGIMNYISVRKLSDLADEVDRQMYKKELSTELDGGMELQTSATRGFVLSGRDSVLQRREEGIAQSDRVMAELKKLLQTEREKELNARIEENTRQLRDIQGRAIELRRAGKTQGATELLLCERTTQIRSNVEKAIDEMTALIETLRDAAQTKHEKAEINTIRSVEMLAVAGLVIGVFVTILIVNSIQRALSRMVGVIQEIANKNLTIPDMEITSKDELGRAGIALNQMKNSLQEIIHQISDTAEHVATASEELSATSQQISANSEETSAQAGTVSQATQQVSQNLQSVSTGAEEMTATIQSIASNAHEAATVASNAVQTAQSANSTVAKLGASSAEIGEVIKVITSIAQQTNLLALNATIEAARAGEAGKGFAVVANEVKELAKQTAKATEDISRKIMAIQMDTKGAVEAIGSITGVIHQINDISSTIATAVEEQSATTNEMTRNVADAAKGSGEITHNIEGVAEAARGTSSSAQESQKAATELAELAARLHGLVGQFKTESAPGFKSPPHTNEQARSIAAVAGR